MVLIGACQTPEILGDVDAALGVVHDFAGRSDADLLLFPECFLQGYLVTERHVRGHALEIGSSAFSEVLSRLTGLRQTLVLGMIERAAAATSTPRWSSRAARSWAATARRS